MEIMLVVRTI